jgi:hypothetical protein
MGQRSQNDVISDKCHVSHEFVKRGVIYDSMILENDWNFLSRTVLVTHEKPGLSTESPGIILLLSVKLYY